jgi:hypothetical protein
MYVHAYFFPGLPVTHEHIHVTKNILLANVFQFSIFDPVTYNPSTAGLGRKHVGFQE